jgi:hypothetical protein
MIHGLIPCTLERFVRDTYGSKAWLSVLRKVDLAPSGFEAMMVYEAHLIDRVLVETSDVLKRRQEVLFEDIGTYLVSNANAESVRRLLRFGGSSFEEFLRSLDDLPARARLAVTDLHLPRIDLHENNPRLFNLHVYSSSGVPAGFGHVLMGLLRGIADDYGALALLEHKGGHGGVEVITVELLDPMFADGRVFSLGAGGPESRAFQDV